MFILLSDYRLRNINGGCIQVTFTKGVNLQVKKIDQAGGGLDIFAGAGMQPLSGTSGDCTPQGP